MQQMTTTLENNNDSKIGKLQQLGRITVRYKNKLSRKRVLTRKYIVWDNTRFIHVCSNLKSIVVLM